ncbi:hypothetical protein GCM10027294_28590 [Marinactinospora endophytica]
MGATLADVSFEVLGRLAVRVDGTPVQIQGRKRRILLAALLLRADHTVPVADLVRRMWGEVPVDAYRPALQVHVARLRSVLDDAGMAPIIAGGSDGYRAELAGYRLDLARMRALLAAAREARRQGDLPGESDALAQALGLWRGPVLAEIDSAVLHEHDVTRITDELLRAAERRFDVELLLGRHDSAIAPLRTLATLHPDREAVARLLMIALYRSGRQSDALDVYERTRRHLAGRLGVDPGPALQRTFHAILRGDLEERTVVPRPRPADAGDGREGPPPAQLPAAPPVFVGRREQLAELDRLADEGSEASRALVSGPPGAGRTALAVHWAHRVAHRFPDGQLYVDLRGQNGTPLDPADVMRRLVRPFGFHEGLPAAVDERAALLRSVFARRRLLLVLDNASSAAQVRPLLPGSPSCATVVTSDFWLADLIAREGVLTVAVGELADDEARALLDRLAGAQRTAAEPGATDRLLDLTGRLPLPLRMAAAWLVTHPSTRIGALADAIAAHRDADPVARTVAALDGDPRFLLDHSSREGGRIRRS